MSMPYSELNQTMHVHVPHNLLLACEPGTKTSEKAGHKYEGERAPYLHNKLSAHYERLQTVTYYCHLSCLISDNGPNCKGSIFATEYSHIAT